MSENTFLKGLFAAIFSSIFGWTVFSRYDSELGSESEESTRQRFLPYIPGIILPVFLVSLTILSIPQFGLRETFELLLSMCFGIFLHISFYYLILMLLIPILRRYISSRACAMLWIIPNYLYLTQQSYMRVPSPLLVIHISEKIFGVVITIWLLGFAVVLIRACWQHIIFRRKILQGAFPSNDPKVLKVWLSEIEYAKVKNPKYKLVISEHVSTPLSIGFFERSIRVVLPSRKYTEEELSLILRHEIIHICRGDCLNKFFLVFCCAMCWFNPLMWIAMRKSADDLELSCDETVLLHADKDRRRQYANLILNTVGDERGFTTCLSASASALRYRLKNIVKPSSYYSGAFTVALVFFLLCMSCGYASIAYGDFTGLQLFYQVDSGAIDPAYEIYTINTSLFEHNGFVKCTDEDALETYLADLHFSKLSGNFSFEEYENHLLIIYNGRNGDFGVSLKDRYLTITPLGRGAPKQETYYASSDIDWEYISSLLYTRHIQSPALPFPPMLDIVSDSIYFSCPATVVAYTVDDISQSEEDWWFANEAFTLTDPAEGAAYLNFSHNLSEAFSVEITDLEGNFLDSYTSNHLDNNVLPFLPQNAHYIIHTVFEDEHSCMEVEYAFTVQYTH